MKHVSRMVAVALFAVTANHIAGAADGTWTNLTNGQLWSVAGNWQDDVVADGTDATAAFNTLDITVDNTVHLDAPRTVGNLIFGDTVTNSAAGWTLGNNGNGANLLTLAGSAPTITVGALADGKTAAVDVNIIGTDGLTKAGGGTLSLNHTNNYSGVTAVSGGELRLLPTGDQLGFALEPPVDGLALWLDATQGVTTNASGNVAQWDDRSGNNRHASNALSTGPTVAADINGLSTLRFTKSQSQYLECGGIDSLTDATVFIVNKLASVSTTQLSAFFAATGQVPIASCYPIHYQIETNKKLNFFSGGSYLFNNTDVTAGTVQITEYVESSCMGRFYRNGMADGYGTRTYAKKRLDAFKIGAWMPFDAIEHNRRFLDGSIGEILIYTRALSEVERQTVGLYLTLKWGVLSNGYSYSLDVLPAQTAAAISDGATLALDGVNQTVASISGVAGSQLLLGGTLTVDGDHATTFAGAVSGGGGLVVKGGGSLVLAGAAAYLSSTRLENGVLAVADRLYATGAALDARVEIVDGGLLELGKWGYTSYDSLGQFPTAADRLFISNGTIRVTGTTFGERAVTVAGTATLDAAAGANWHVVAEGSPWIFNTGAGLLLTGVGNGCFAKGFNGSGGIRKTGSGKWTLAGSNTVNGPISVDSGTLQVASGVLSSVPVAGAALWLDATRGVVTNANGNVTLWTDLSGNERNATSVNGPTVTAGINSQSTLRFTGAQSQYLECFGLMNMSNLTIFVTHRLISYPSSFFALLAEDATSSGGVHYNINPSKEIEYYVGSSTPYTIKFNSKATNTTAQIYEILDHNGVCQFYMDGVADGGGTRTTNLKRLNDFRIGAWNDSRYYDGYIGEIIIYTRVLNETERAEVYAYLNAKWMNPAGIGTPAPGASDLLATNAAVAVAASATLDLGGQSHTVATLQGSGTITNGAVTASIHPGGVGQTGTLDVAQATLSGTLVIDTTSTTSDCLQVTGDLDLSGLRLEFSETCQLNNFTQYQIITYTGELTAPFGAVDIPGSWEVRYTNDKEVKLICNSGTMIKIH